MSTARQLLEQLNLKKREIDVYIALLGLGEASASDVASTVKIARTTAASVLDRLCELGFVTKYVRGGKRTYWIEDPHVLVEKERSRLDVFEELSGKLHVEYHKTQKKPRAEIFESSESIHNLMTRAVGDAKKGDHFYVFETPGAKNYEAVLSNELFRTMSQQKVKKGIFTKALIPHGHEQFIRPGSLDFNVELRVLPARLRFELSLWVLADSIVLFSGTHAFAIRINHTHTYESFLSLFEYLWSVSEPLKK